MCLLPPVNEVVGVGMERIGLPIRRRVVEVEHRLDIVPAERLTSPRSFDIVETRRGKEGSRHPNANRPLHPFPLDIPRPVNGVAPARRAFVIAGPPTIRQGLAVLSGKRRLGTRGLVVPAPSAPLLRVPGGVAPPPGAAAQTRLPSRCRAGPSPRGLFELIDGCPVEHDRIALYGRDAGAVHRRELGWVVPRSRSTGAQCRPAAPRYSSTTSSLASSS